MQACFIGHRRIEKTEKVKIALQKVVTDLIQQGVKNFLFGGIGEFDRLSWEVVTAFKKEYPYIKRVYIRSSYPYISREYEEYLQNSYEETYFPVKLNKAGKYAYVERNYKMIDDSSYCIFYYNENYIVPCMQKSKSGTKVAYTYALKKKKEVINLYK